MHADGSSLVASGDRHFLGSLVSSNGGNWSGCFSTVTRNVVFPLFAYRPLSLSPSQRVEMGLRRTGQTTVTLYSPVGTPSPATNVARANSPFSFVCPVGRYGRSPVCSLGWNVTIASLAGLPSTSTIPLTGYVSNHPRFAQPAEKTMSARVSAPSPRTAQLPSGRCIVRLRRLKERWGPASAPAQIGRAHV